MAKKKQPERTTYTADEAYQTACGDIRGAKRSTAGATINVDYCEDHRV